MYTCFSEGDTFLGLRDVLGFILFIYTCFCKDFWHSLKRWVRCLHARFPGHHMSVAVGVCVCVFHQGFSYF